MERLSAAQNAFLGVIAGTVEVCIDQPILYAKNASQQRLKFTLDPRMLYRGLAASVANVGILTGIQFYGAGLLRTYFHNQNRMKLERQGKVSISSHSEEDADATDETLDMTVASRATKLTSNQTLISALFGGVLSGIACGPMELVMIQQQRSGKSLAYTIKNILNKHGVKGLLRGTSTACGREGIFTAGYLGIAPMVEEKIHSMLHDRYHINQKNNPYLGQILAAFSTGLIASILSHPMDTIKTNLQGDIHGTQFKTVSQTWMKLLLYKDNHNHKQQTKSNYSFVNNKLFGLDRYNISNPLGKYNWQRVYSGFGWRYLRMAMSFFIILRSKEIIAPILYPTII